MSTAIQSDSGWRDTFIESAARLFYVYAYAEFVEDSEREDDGHAYPRPGGGENWMDFAPEATPPNAYALAGQLWGSVEVASKVGMYVLACRANKADGGEWAVDIDAEAFGSSLAWMAMGAGPSWFDDHECFEISVPDMEVSSFTFDPAAYRE